jgi:hypothetical protein
MKGGSHLVLICIFYLNLKKNRSTFFVLVQHFVDGEGPNNSTTDDDVDGKQCAFH